MFYSTSYKICGLLCLSRTFKFAIIQTIEFLKSQYHSHVRFYIFFTIVQNSIITHRNNL